MLQTLYEATGGANWSDAGGWRVYAPAGDPCITRTHFSGIGCYDPCDDAIEGPDCRLGRISRLDRSWNSVGGTLPTQLGLLDQLDWLDLSENQISGTLPSQLGKLDRMTHFFLQGNSISGTMCARRLHNPHPDFS